MSIDTALVEQDSVLKHYTHNKIWDDNGTSNYDGNELQLKIMKDTADGNYYFDISGMDLSGHFKETKITDRYLLNKGITFSDLAVVLTDKKGERHLYTIDNTGIANEPIDSSFVKKLAPGWIGLNSQTTRYGEALFAYDIFNKATGNGEYLLHILATAEGGQKKKVVKGTKEKAGNEGTQKPKEVENKGGTEDFELLKSLLNQINSQPVPQVQIKLGNYNEPSKKRGEEGYGSFFRIVPSDIENSVEAEGGALYSDRNYDNHVTKTRDGNDISTETRGTGAYGRLKFNARALGGKFAAELGGHTDDYGDRMPINRKATGKQTGPMTTKGASLRLSQGWTGAFRVGEKLGFGVSGHYGEEDWNQNYESINIHDAFKNSGYSGRLNYGDNNFDIGLKAGRDFTSLEEKASSGASDSNPFTVHKGASSSYVGGNIQAKLGDNVRIGPAAKYTRIHNLPELTQQDIDDNLAQYGGILSVKAGDFNIKAKGLIGRDGKVEKKNLGIVIEYAREVLGFKSVKFRAWMDQVKAQLSSGSASDSKIYVGVGFGLP